MGRRLYPHEIVEEEDEDVEWEGSLHVVPSFAGEREHEPSTRCWCEPEMIQAEDPRLGYERDVWAHRRPH